MKYKYTKIFACILVLLFIGSTNIQAQNCTTALQPQSVTVFQGPPSGIPPTAPGTLVESSTITVQWDPQCGTRAGDGCEFGDNNSLFWYVGLYGQNAPVPNGIDAECGSSSVTLDCPAVAPAVGLIVNGGGDYNGLCLAPKSSTCTSSEFSQMRPPAGGDITSWHTFGDDGQGFLGACEALPLEMTLPVCPGQCYNVVVWEFVIDQPSGTGPNADGGAGGTGNTLPFAGMDANISCGNITLLSESPPSDVVSICIDAADNTDNAMIQNPTLTVTNSVNGDPAASVCAALNNAAYVGTYQGQPEDIGDPSLADPCEASNVDQGIPAINNASDPLLSDGSVDQTFGGTGNAGDAGDISVVLGGAGNSANGQLGLGANVVEVNCREAIGIVFSTPEGCKGFTDQTVFGLPACDFSDGSLLSTNAKVYITNNGTPLPSGVQLAPYPACYAGGSGTGTCATNSATGYGANYTAQFGNFISADDVNDPCITNLVGNPFEGSGTNPFTLPGALSGIDFGDGVARDVSTICVTYEDPCDGSNSVTCVKFISDAPPLSGSVVACNETCPGAGDGQLVVYNVAGGSDDPNSDSDYTDGLSGAGSYSVTTVAGPALPAFTYQGGSTWATAASVAPGVYTVEIRDALAPNDTFDADGDDTMAACGAACPIQLVVEVLPGPVLTSTPTVTAGSCTANGTASINIEKLSRTGNGQVIASSGPGTVPGDFATISSSTTTPTSGLFAGCPDDILTNAAVVEICITNFQNVTNNSGSDLAGTQIALSVNGSGPVSFISNGNAFGGGGSLGTGPVTMCYTSESGGGAGPDNAGGTYGAFFAGLAGNGLSIGLIASDGFGTGDSYSYDDITITINDQVCTTESNITAFCDDAGPDNGDGLGAITSADQTIIWTSAAADETTAEPFNFLTFPNGDGETSVEFDNTAAFNAGVAAGTVICYDATAYVPGNEFDDANNITDNQSFMTDCYKGVCCEITEQVCFTVVDCRTCPAAADVMVEPTPICDGDSYNLSMVVAVDSDEDGIPDDPTVAVDPAQYTEGVDYYIQWDVSSDGGATWGTIFDGDPNGAAQTGGAAFTYTPLQPVSGCTPEAYQFRVYVACLLPGAPYSPALPFQYDGSFDSADACDAVATADPTVQCFTYPVDPDIPPCATITTIDYTIGGNTACCAPSWASEANVGFVGPDGSCSNQNGGDLGFPDSQNPFVINGTENGLYGAPLSGGPIQICFFDDFNDGGDDGTIDQLVLQVNYEVPPDCDFVQPQPAELVGNVTGEVQICTDPILGVDYTLPLAGGCDPTVTILCTPYAGAYDPATGAGAVPGEEGALVLYSTDGGTTYTSTDPYDAVSVTATDNSDLSDLTVEYQILVPGCPTACNAVTGTFMLSYPDAPTTTPDAVCAGDAAGITGLTATCGTCPASVNADCVESVNLTDNGGADGPFGGTGNANNHSYTGTCSGTTIETTASVASLDVSVLGYVPNNNGAGLNGEGCNDIGCPPDPATFAGENYWVTISVAGTVVYDCQYDPAGNLVTCFTGTGDPLASDISIDNATDGFTYNQGDAVVVDVYPNCFTGCGAEGGDADGVQYQNEWDATVTTYFTATFPGTAIAAPPIALTWWDAATGGTQQGTTSPLDPTGLTAAEGAFDINTPGDYTFYAQCACGTCTSPRTPAVFTVYQNPTAVPAAGAACEGQGSVTVTSNPANGTAPYTFSWSGPSGQVATTQDVTLNPVGAGDAGTWTVTVTDDNGCEVIETVMVTVNAPPTIAPTANMPCDGQQDLNITGNPAGGTAPYTFSWQGPSGQTSNMENPTVSPGTNANDEGTWNVTVTDANGCTGTGSVIVTINDLPVAPPTVPFTICEDGAVPGGSGVEATGCTGTINWYTAATGGTSVGSGTPFDPTTATGTAAVDPSMPGAYTFYAECTDANGCIGPRSPVIFNVYALPVLSTSETCEEDCIGTYSSDIMINLGTWNSILDGVDVSYTVTTTAGTLSATSISGNATVTVSGIPAGQTATVTVVTGTENNVCSADIVTVDPECPICPTAVGDFTDVEYQCEAGTQAPSLPTDAEILATVQAINSGGANDLSLVSILWSPSPNAVPSYTGDGCETQTFDYTLSIICSEGNGACNLVDVSVYSITVFPEISGSVNYPESPVECEVELTMSCPSFDVNWTANDQAGGTVTGTQADLIQTPTGYIFDPDALIVPAGSIGDVEFTIINPDPNVPADCESFTLDSEYTCCIAEAGGTVPEDVCPPGDPDNPYDADLTVYVNGCEIFNLYTTQLLVVDANGVVLGIYTVPINVSPVPNLGNGSIDIPYADWSAWAGQEVFFYTYSEQNSNPPVPTPTVGSTLSDIGSLDDICFDLSVASPPLYLPNPMVTECEEQFYEGSQGGITPFYYNKHRICVSGGTQPYNYHWETTGYVRHSVDKTPLYGDEMLVIIYGDHAIWAVTVYDANGCTIIPDWAFTNDPNGAGATSEILDVYNDYIIPASDCYEEDGTITLYTEGGIPPYTYDWDGPFVANNVTVSGDGSVGAPYTLDGLPQGWYTVTVTDSGALPDANGIFPGSGTQYPNPNMGDQQTTTMWYWVHCNFPYTNPDGTGLIGRGKVANIQDGAGIGAYPNPFNNETTLQFGVAETEQVSISLFSVDGKEISQLFRGQANGGEVYNLPFKAGILPSGIYIVRMTTQSGIIRHDKLMLTK